VTGPEVAGAVAQVAAGLPGVIGLGQPVGQLLALDLVGRD
jgi:hypothetical protein